MRCKKASAALHAHGEKNVPYIDECGVRASGDFCVIIFSCSSIV